MYKHITAIFLFLTVCLSMLYAAGQAQQSSLEGAGELTAIQSAVQDSIRRADSIAQEATRRRVEAATEAFKHIKFVRYDGITEAELYPQVAAAHAKVMEALNDPRTDNDSKIRLRSMLLDFDPLLINAAIYYSGLGNAQKMNEMAALCVDTRLRPDMKKLPFSSAGQQAYPAIVYCAASSAYNAGNYDKAIGYFQEYVDTHAPDQREQVVTFLGHACIAQNCPQRALDTLLQAVNDYPANYNLLMITLQNCLNAGATDKMTALLDRALLMRPDDEKLMELQAALYENQGNFASAMELYSTLYEHHPESLNLARHLALCYYNLGCDYYNRSLNEPDQKKSTRSMRQSRSYFLSSMGKLEQVVDSDPSDMKYVRALGMTYGALGENDKLAGVNKRLVAMGQTPIAAAGMPETVNYDDASARTGGDEIPSFQDFARTYVEQNLAEWTTRKEFEKKEDFEKRVSESGVYTEYQRLCKLAEAEYVKKYASKLRISDLSLEPYDIDNETYKINSTMGPIIIKVPMKGNEAQTFKAQWNVVRFRNPKYYIDNDKVAIAAVDVEVPGGKTYSYNAEKAATYDFTDVQVDVSSFLAQGKAVRQQQGSGQAASQKGNATTTLRATSDVDRDIPFTSRKADKTVALIWANENYKNVTNVSSALNDGDVFATYCRNTLGIPDSQVILIKDATYAEMLSSVGKLKQLVDALGSGIDVIFYFAGHGIPDEATKDSYLLPVDGDGVMTMVTYKLGKLYDDLASTRADNVIVFLDACFSGATRDGGMLAEARGVALKPKNVNPSGSMYVLSAASDQETALPYTEKNHGIFTYYLLKKIQDTKGNVTLKDLADYVKDNVKKNSLPINNKIQTPTVQVSGRLAETWTSKKLRP